MLETTHMPLSLETLDHSAKMDIFESEIAKLPQNHLPLIHRFTDGMYIREINMPAGTIATSRTHKTNHPFVIQKGMVDIVDEEGNIERITAPYLGITHRGTRRVFRVLDDVVLITFHATDKQDPVEIGNDITESNNELLPQDFKQAYLGRKEDTWRLS